MSCAIPEDLAELFEGGVSILVGTRDARLQADATRGVGAVVHADRQHMTVYLPVAVSARAVANLQDNGMVAVGFSRMLDHKTLQVKGVLEKVADATEADREVVARYHAGFMEGLSLTGIPRSTTRRLNVWPCHAVTFRVTDIFQQTPGPDAGARIGGATT